MRRVRYVLARLLAVLAILLVIASLAAVLVVRSGWFHERVRTGILAELEKATGGRAELGQFSFDWKSLTASVGTLVIHGKEREGEPPFLRVGMVNVQFRIISVAERDVDLASAVIDGPEIHIIIYADGSNNVPSPGGPGESNWAQDMLRVRMGRYDIRNGIFELDQRKVPFHLQGEELKIAMRYEPAEPAYAGEVSSRRMTLIAGGRGPVELGVDGSFRLNQNRMTFSGMHVAMGGSRAEVDGSLENLRLPYGTFNMKATVGIAEAMNSFGFDEGLTGTMAFNGKLSVNFGEPFGFGMNGRMNASGVAFTRGRLKVDQSTVQADVQMTLDRVTLRGIRAQALDSTITGSGELTAWKRFHMDGAIDGLGLRRAAGVLTDRPVAWSGQLSGPFTLDTSLAGGDAKVTTNLMIARGGDGVPVDGQLDAAYDQANGTVGLGASWIATPATRVDVSGTLGQTLKVKLRTSDPDEALLALAMVEADAPTSLPLKLKNGVVTAEGTVTGTIEDPHFAGPVTVTNGIVEGREFDKASATLEADRNEIKATQATLVRGKTDVSGNVTLTARAGSFDDAAVVASLNLRNADLEPLAKEAGVTAPMSGVGSAAVKVSGTVGNPEAEATIDVAQPEAFGEQISRLRGTVRYKSDAIDIAGGEATDGTATVRFSGTYKRAGADWKSGDVTFDAATQNLPANRIDHIARMQPSIDGVLTGRVQGRAQVTNGEVAARSVTADLAIDRVTVDKQSVGSLTLGIETRGEQLQALVTGKVRDVTVEARGNWALTGEEAGSGTVRVSRMTVAMVHSLSMLGSGGAGLHEDDVPFEGFVEGGAAFTVSLRHPEDFTARVTLDTVQLNPKANQALKLGVQPQDIVLRNETPVIVEVNSQALTLRQAQFTGRGTSIQGTGAIPLRAGSNADLAVRGNVNLILLQLLNPDLLARGDATVQATIRGSIQNPALNGRLELKGASLYFSDLPNGVDNANGSILFDRNRATIEKLTAETGGGTLAMTGLVEFSAPLIYRLQATATQVRVRSPEDLSTTFNAQLGLSGSPDASTLSGTITINRAAFNPRTDLGQLLAQASKPVPAPSAPSDLLRGLQFDVRIESGPNFGFETTLTRDVEAEVDLHLRGTPLRPVLLGNVSVNQGEVQVFGNKYTIDRGDIHFLNPVKIEPSFDMDLETRARGITVNISLSGTMQQLKVNYSSDPPLQSSEIIALLAVGRDPTSTATTVGNPTANSGLAEAGSGLIGQAVNAQISSRLQRFFGASRVKIDPTLTGVDNLPQARLTLEQQVSKDITLTFITNLNRTQEQLVRVEWDFNRNWSAVAVRDPSGLFGIDFQYRKRF